MGRPAARRSLIRKSDQLHDSDDDHAPSRDKKARLDASPTPEDGEADKDDDNDNEEDDDDGTLPAIVKARLKYIESHTDGLTNIYLRMIMAELDHYMGSRSGGNAQVADDIVQHCRIVAYTGRSNLLEEKRAVHQAWAACWGGCVGDEDEDDPDFYDVPKAVQDRVRICMELMDELPKDELVKIMKALKTYKGPLDGYDMVGSVTDHLDDLAAKRHDIVAEERIIRGIYDAYNSKEAGIPEKGSEDVQARLEIIQSHLSLLSKTYLKDVAKAFAKSSGYCDGVSGTNKVLIQKLFDHCQQMAVDNEADLEEEQRIVEGAYKECYPNGDGSE